MVCRSSHIGLSRFRIGIENEFNPDQQLSVVVLLFVDIDCIHSDLPMTSDAVRRINFSNVYIVPNTPPDSRNRIGESTSWSVVGAADASTTAIAPASQVAFTITNTTNKPIRFFPKSDVALRVSYSSTASQQPDVLPDSVPYTAGSTTLGVATDASICGPLRTLGPKESIKVGLLYFELDCLFCCFVVCYCLVVVLCVSSPLFVVFCFCFFFFFGCTLFFFLFFFFWLLIQHLVKHLIFFPLPQLVRST